MSLVTGVAMYAIGTGWNRWATLAHGAAGVALLGLAPWKSVIARRGLRRRGVAGALPSLGLVVALVVALASGFAHRAGARDLGPLLVNQVHVGAAVVAAVLTVVHLRTRPVPLPPRRIDLGRRRALRTGLLAGGSMAVTTALPHASERYTRSLERGSFQPAAMPVTQWFLDEVQRLDADGWRLRVGDRAWSLDELAALPQVEVVTTLDCTGGWYATQRWTGVPLSHVLAASGLVGGRSVEARSVTGYRRRFPFDDAPDLLVATGAGGAPLSAGHGAPARIVAPGRRGFWWVKWLAEVDVDDVPWWFQPPFPLR